MDAQNKPSDSHCPPFTPNDAAGANSRRVSAADDPARLLTEAEAAERLRISVQSIQRLRRRGEIGHIKVTRKRFLYTERHLERFLDGRARAAEAMR